MEHPTHMANDSRGALAQPHNSVRRHRHELGVLALTGLALLFTLGVAFGFISG